MIKSISQKTFVEFRLFYQIEKPRYKSLSSQIDIGDVVIRIGLVILLCILFIVLAWLIDPEIVGKITGVVSTSMTVTTTLPPTTTITTVPVITIPVTTTTTSLPITSKNVTVIQEIAVNISSVG